MRAPLQSVGIALDIVDALADAEELGVSELARRVGVAKSTARRTCDTLVGRGLLDRTPDGAYRLGLRSTSYGSWPPSCPRSTRRPASARRAAQHARETVQIGVPGGW